MAKQQKPGADETAIVKIDTTNINVPATKADVPATIEALKKQLAALQGNSAEKISLDIDYDGEKIKDIKEVSKLMRISASLHARAAAFEVECKRYKLEGKVKPFSESEKSIAQWEKIIQKAIDELINGGQIKKLEEAIKKLSNFLSDEERLQNELKSIMEGAAEKLD